MKRVRTGDLKPGMIPAAEVSSHNGRVLLAPGQPLTDELIVMLKAWGVHKIDIENTGGQGDDPFSRMDESPEPERAALDELFRFTDREHPAIQELYAFCLLRKPGGAEGGGGR